MTHSQYLTFANSIRGVRANRVTAQIRARAIGISAAKLGPTDGICFLTAHNWLGQSWMTPEQNQAAREILYLEQKLGTVPACGSDHSERIETDGQLMTAAIAIVLAILTTAVSGSILADLFSGAALWLNHGTMQSLNDSLWAARLHCGAAGFSKVAYYETWGHPVGVQGSGRV